MQRWWNNVKYELGNWAEVLGYVVAFILLILLVAFAWTVIVAALIGFVGLAVVLWAFGLKFVVTENGKKVGYVKWFTYHRLR